MSYICSIKLKTVINMETKKFAEENVGKFFMFGGERCRLVGLENDAINPCLVIEKSNGGFTHPSRFVQMWNGKVKRAWYVTKDQLIPIKDVSARQFAEDNAGRYYRFTDCGRTEERVRVVGYHGDGGAVLVSYRGGWHPLKPGEDMLVVKTRATRFWYVSVDSLEEISLC